MPAGAQHKKTRSPVKDCGLKTGQRWIIARPAITPEEPWEVICARSVPMRWSQVLQCGARRLHGAAADAVVAAQEAR